MALLCWWAAAAQDRSLNPVAHRHTAWVAEPRASCRGRRRPATDSARDRDGTRLELRRQGGEHMGRAAHFVVQLYAWVDGIEWLWRLVVRLSVGIEFFGSGLGKLGKLPGFIQYFRTLGVPFPELQAPFVASVELVCGMLIVVGLATRPAALMLCGVMTVAIVTAAAPEKHITASWHGLLEFLYLPEVLLLLLLTWLVLAGPGRASLDARFGARR